MLHYKHNHDIHVKENKSRVQSKTEQNISTCEVNIGRTETLKYNDNKRQCNIYGNKTFDNNYHIPNVNKKGWLNLVPRLAKPLAHIYENVKHIVQMPMLLDKNSTNKCKKREINK